MLYLMLFLWMWFSAGCINGLCNYSRHHPLSPIGLKVFALGPIGFFVDIK